MNNLFLGLKFMKMKLLVICIYVIAIVYAQDEEDHSRHPDCQVSACPRDDQGNQTYKLDCTKYVSCADGHPTVKDCPSGYKYNIVCINNYFVDNRYYIY